MTDPDAEFVALRRDLHRHPELSYQETRTSDIVADRLQHYGYEVERGLGGTGVVGHLRRGSGRKHLGLRADMDALPIQEASALDWASRTPGVMHACGHDGHTAMLLAAAKRLADDVSLSGALTLIFQPAEEYGQSDSGAARMIADGLFERYPCDAVFAMHNLPGFDQGELLFREGPMMASSDHVIITLTGVGGHGGMPHQSSDPVVAASSLVMALQTLVSRNVDPQEAAVVSAGALHTGTAYNVIPESARIELSVRALRPEVRDLLERRIKAMAPAHAQGYGLEAKVDYRRGYPPLINAPEATAFARQVALDLLGPDLIVSPCPAITGSEDFAFMLEQRPGCYLMIGNGADAGPNGCMVHNPRYDFNDANISVGAAFWTALAKRFLVE